MSDTPRGPGWWQATDGRWYPPAPTTPADHKQQVRERKLAVRRAKARAQVQGLLEPGEQIRAMFVSQTGPSPRGVATVGLTANLVRYWNVAVTDRNIVVIDNEGLRARPTRVLRRLPRQTRLGPFSWKNNFCDTLGEELTIDSRYFEDARAADEAAGWFDD